LHVEQLKLCISSRKELREKKRQNRRRMKEQWPRLEGGDEETDSNDSASEDDREGSLYSYTSYERRNVTERNSKVSTFTPAGEEKEIGQVREGERERTLVRQVVSTRRRYVCLRRTSYVGTGMYIRCAHEHSVIIKSKDGRRPKHARI
jgi:hypothetical protein